nr:hypothetical protein [Actinomycetales bacterium]
MTLAQLRDFHPTRPHRSGQAWDSVDYEGILNGVREGLGFEGIANRIGRRSTAVSGKVRDLLPPEERKARGPVALELLKRHVDDPGYDWRAVLATPDPPRPVVVEKNFGFAGFAREDLIPLIHAVLSAGDSVPREMRTDAVRMAVVLNLWHRIETFRRDWLYLRSDAEMTYHAANEEARQWIYLHSGQQEDELTHPWSRYAEHPY